MLEFSFSHSVVLHPVMQRLYVASIESYELLIDEALASTKPLDESVLRDRLPLDSAPFQVAKRMRMSFSDIAKDNDIRLSFQALFLFILRRKMTPKCKSRARVIATICPGDVMNFLVIDASLESFLERYPDLNDRSAVEQGRLRYSANWMVLTFCTLQPRNNKSFIVHLIPKIVEGKNARYITGSGQTKATADRVNLFRTEGECEKIQRPPRKRKDAQEGMLPGSTSMTSLSSATGPSASNAQFMPTFPSHPSLYALPFYPHSLLQSPAVSSQQHQAYIAAATAAVAAAQQQPQLPFSLAESGLSSLPSSAAASAADPTLAAYASLYSQFPASLLALQKQIAAASGSNPGASGASSTSALFSGAPYLSMLPQQLYQQQLQRLNSNTNSDNSNDSALSNVSAQLQHTLPSHDSLSSTASVSSDSSQQREKVNSSKSSSKTNKTVKKEKSASKKQQTLSRSLSASNMGGVVSNGISSSHWLHPNSTLDQITPSPPKRAKTAPFVPLGSATSYSYPDLTSLYSAPFAQPLSSPFATNTASGPSALDRAGMLQNHHNHNSNSSMGLDALLCAAECLEEHAQLA